MVSHILGPKGGPGTYRPMIGSPKLNLFLELGETGSGFAVNYIPLLFFGLSRSE